jgi:predicted SAM-dependent methyltransferase
MKKLIHFGCGPIILRSKSCEWVNVDISSANYPDIVMDYLKSSEIFGENAFDEGFSCHSLEHCAWPEGVQKFFSEAKKIIKPGGTLRIVVPDLGIIAKKYVAGESLQDVFNGPYWTYKDLPATRFLFWARGWEHTVLFDGQLLRELAEDVGFTDFRVMPFGISQIPELHNLDRFQSESISIECRA